MLKSVENIKNTNDKIDNIVLKNGNKLKGYGARCKVCNHSKRDHIEELRELGYSFSKIIQELKLDGFISEMSLSRHFKNHYPESKKYNEKMELLKEKEIQKAIKNYPPIKSYFMEDYDNFIDTFFNVYGFCIMNQCLCDIIPKKSVLYPEEVLSKLNEKYNSIDVHNHVIRLKFLEHIIRCYQCQLANMQSFNNVLTEIIISKLFNKELDFEKDLIPLIIDKDFNKSEIVKELENIK